MNKYPDSITHSLKEQSTVIFDTSIHSDNLGDEIIMSSCNRVLDDCLGAEKRIYVPTHTVPAPDEIEVIKKANLKILCGTNVLSPDFDRFNLWKMPRDFSGYSDTIAMGIGWMYYSSSITEKSRDVYRRVFSERALHSVRNSYTEKKMWEMGIFNVVNTGCPTLWQLTPEHCNRIPSVKASKVVTALTGWTPDIDADNYMLNVLEREYEKVYIWMQGNTDYQYFSQLKHGKIEILPGGVDAYTQLLRSGDIDYVGNRLHAGIHALNCGVRALIISIDNRATEMGKDFHLPVIPREKLSERLKAAINQDRKTVLQIPWDNIERWKAQFKTLDAPDTRRECLKRLAQSCTQEEFVDILSKRIDRQQARMKQLEYQNGALRESVEQERAHVAQLEEQNGRLSMNLERQQARIEQLEAQNQYLSESFNTISNAFFWKITKPARFTLDVVKWAARPHAEKGLLRKGLYSLRTNGVGVTWQKAMQKIYFDESYVQAAKQSLFSEQELAGQRSHRFSRKIKFSIVVPLYNTPERFLRAMIESVQAQTYADWELCMADGSDAQHGEVEHICGEYTARDSRICYRKLEKNLGISGNTNACLDLVTGDYIGLFDHDDLLHPAALFEVMRTIENTGADFVYTDESTFHDTPEDAYLPHFKPDFAPDNLRETGNRMPYMQSALERKIGEQTIFISFTRRIYL